MHALQAERGASLIRTSHWRIILSVALVTYLADLTTKMWAVASLEGNPPRYIVGSILRWEFARNPGAAFSSFTGATFALTLISIAALLYLSLRTPRVSVRSWSYPWGGLAGGVLGNLTDRIFRDPGIFRGHVVDWIGFPNWALFNIADSAIVLSVLAMAILSWRGSSYHGTTKG
jgi:signal peptidase II